MKQFLRIHFLLFSLLQVACLSWAQSNHADCNSAKILCNKAPIVFPELTGWGNLSESPFGDCFRSDFAETNSVWLKWKVAEPGTLTFTLLPLIESDDLDFMLFRTKGLEQCGLKEVVRCMSAGPLLGENSEVISNCTGATGLRAGEEHEEMGSGCSKYGENFLRPIEMNAGEYYCLFIHNFRSTSGLMIEWGGTGTFELIPDQCESQTSSIPVSIGINTGIQFSDPFPNPTSDYVRLSAQSDQSYSGLLQVIGSDGQVELNQPFTLDSGRNTLELPIATLRDGVHFIKLRTNGKTHICRFVKS